MCTLRRDAKFEEILSCRAIEHWKSDSLYICGDDVEEFDARYGEIFRGGYYGNGRQGPVDYCGINYYPLEHTMRIAERLRQEGSGDIRELLSWLADAGKYNGMYLLGL